MDRLDRPGLCFFTFGMNGESQKGFAIQAAAGKIELIEGLQRAIDRKYRYLLGAARADWQRLFAGKESGAVSAKVHIPVAPPAKPAGLPGSGFLKSGKQPRTKDAAKGRVARFAN